MRPGITRATLKTRQEPDSRTPTTVRASSKWMNLVAADRSLLMTRIALALRWDVDYGGQTKRAQERDMTVFISHHSSRQGTAAHVAGYLERRGISAWYAPRDISPGSEWDQSISAAIQGSSALILLFCAQADESRHVKREVGIADKSRVPIYWLRLESVEPLKLGYFLNETQWIDWLDNRDGTLDQLVATLQALSASDNSPGWSERVSINPPSSVSAHSISPPSPGWPRGIFAFESERLAGEATALLYLRCAPKSLDCSMILPTGRASTPIFRAINRLAGPDEPPFSEAHLINDTETFGVWQGHDTSRTRHVNEMLIGPLAERGLAPPESRLHLLSGIITEDDPIVSARRTLRRWPPTLHAVSVAPNGEVLAFEVGTYTDAEALADTGVGVIELSEHGRGYIDPDQPSRSVLSVGIGTALSASILVILAYPGNKANIVRQMVKGPVSPGIPATLLSRHHNAFIVTTSTVVHEAGIADIAEYISPEEASERMGQL